MVAAAVEMMCLGDISASYDSGHRAAVPHWTEHSNQRIGIAWAVPKGCEAQGTSGDEQGVQPWRVMLSTGLLRGDDSAADVQHGISMLSNGGWGGRGSAGGV